MTPFQALYGRLPPSIPLYSDGLSRVNEVDQNLLHQDKLLQHLKMNLDIAANRMKQTADQSRHSVEFQVGDMVLLKLHLIANKPHLNEFTRNLQVSFTGLIVLRKGLAMLLTVYSYQPAQGSTPFFMFLF